MAIHIDLAFFDNPNHLRAGCIRTQRGKPITRRRDWNEKRIRKKGDDCRQNQNDLPLKLFHLFTSIGKPIAFIFHVEIPMYMLGLTEFIEALFA